MQSMRYLVVLGCHLWGLLVGERTRVSPHLSFQIPWIDLWGLQGDCLERELGQMKKDLVLRLDSEGIWTLPETEGRGVGSTSGQ